jgi:prepilin-type N-terminal cleavage/methylation domain-containing protein
MKNTRGVTLVELMVALAIVAIVAAIGFPTFQEWQARYRVRSVAQQYQGSLNKMRTLARQEKRSQGIVLMQVAGRLVMCSDDLDLNGNGVYDDLDENCTVPDPDLANFPNREVVPVTFHQDIVAGGPSDPFPIVVQFDRRGLPLFVSNPVLDQNPTVLFGHAKHPVGAHAGHSPGYLVTVSGVVNVCKDDNQDGACD